jgi:hypothetical protein
MRPGSIINNGSLGVHFPRRDQIVRFEAAADPRYIGQRNGDAGKLTCTSGILNRSSEVGTLTLGFSDMGQRVQRNGMSRLRPDDLT